MCNIRVKYYSIYYTFTHKYIITYREGITLEKLQSDIYLFLSEQHWVMAETEYLSYPSNELADVFRKFR
jgi:hypothetical protein